MKTTWEVFEIVQHATDCEAETTVKLRPLNTSENHSAWGIMATGVVTLARMRNGVQFKLWDRYQIEFTKITGEEDQ